MQDQRTRMPELVEYRRIAGKRRAIAFLDAPDFILGMEVKPLTPATFSMLVATDSAFVCGGKAGERDVRNYLWFHSPLYAHCGVSDWQERKKQALRRFEFEMRQPWRRLILRGPDRNRALAFLVLVITDIRRMIDDAFADGDAPKPGTSIEPALATLEGNFIHQMATAYGWTPERTRATPLAQLFQFNRLIRASRGENVRDAGEDRVIEDHLRKRNEALLAAQPKPEAVNHGD